MNALSLPVIPLTITVSLCLVFTFVIFFLREHSRRFSNAERESLLPLADETPRLAGRMRPVPTPTPDHAPARTHGHAHDHDHADDGCGCRTGRKAPCPGCLKRPVSPASS